jgi:hypothetical protein
MPHTRFAVLLVLLVAVNVVAGWLTGGPDGAAAWVLAAWLVTLLLLFGCFVIVGRLPPIVDWRGVIIDQRNRLSLSRLQLVVWSLLVLSAVLTEGLVNTVWGACSPLDLSVPSELWILLGLASGSAVAAPIVLGIKGDQGVLSTRPPNRYAWRDIFYGDEVGNDDQVDFSKVQQFFLTVAVVLVYGIEIGRILLDPKICPTSCAGAAAAAAGSACGAPAILHFPPLSEGIVAIVAVSQVAYIAYKAAPHTKSDRPSG